MINRGKNMKSIEKYEKQFKDLNVDKNGKNQDSYNARGAPHKPILLLSLIKLYEDGKIDLSNINPKTALARNSDLKELSTNLWRALDYERTFDIALPFYYMKDEDFWNIKLKDGFNSPIPNSKKNPTQKDLKERIDKVYFDNELVTLLNEKDKRERLKRALLSGKDIEWFENPNKRIFKDKMGL